MIVIDSWGIVNYSGFIALMILNAAAPNVLDQPMYAKRPINWNLFHLNWNGDF